MPPMASVIRVEMRAFCQVFTRSPMCGRLPQPGELRPVAAVEEVDDQADDQPGEEANPCDDFKPHHEHDAKDDAQDREERAERSTEAAVALWLAITEDEHTDGNQDEGEEGADVGEIGDGSDVQQG